jgi:valyl-tRNA synthetase
MKEKSLHIIIISVLLICSTVFNAVIIQHELAKDQFVENCNDSMELPGDFEEMDSEECYDYNKCEDSLYTGSVSHRFYHKEPESGKPIFNLITPPPQV